jgi:hypothetical protein
VTARAEYTAEEWQLLKVTPYAVGMAVVFSDGAGVIETLRESVALVVAEVEGLQRYPDNELISALANDRNSDAEQGAARVDLEGVAPEDAPAHLRDSALDDCRRAVALLADRSSQSETDGYLHWVIDVARAAALAVRHGGLFSRGPLVDSQERSILADVGKALGVEVGELPAEEGAEAGIAGDPIVPG